MNATQQFMDHTDWVERYAWFGAFKNLQGVNQVRTKQPLRLCSSSNTLPRMMRSWTRAARLRPWGSNTSVPLHPMLAQIINQG